MVKKKPGPKKKIELNDSFRKALDIMEHGTKNVFITGRAGTGKSTLLDHFREHTKKKIVVLAPTGVAALNVRGQTIHSFFKFKPGVTPTNIKRRSDPKEEKNIFRELHAIVIDEISMVRADLLDCVDRALRLERDRRAEPFGGVQMIFIGDLYQLPPVVSQEEEYIFNEEYGSPYFFSARSLRDSEFETVELEKIYRQKDNSFINILNAVRDNSIGEKELRELNERYVPDYKHTAGGMTIYLAPTNRKVSEINDAELKHLDGKEFSYNAKADGEFERNQFPTEEKLRLKIGAQIMLLNNDLRGRWVNGSIGKITGRRKDFNGDVLIVELDSGNLVEVETFAWQIFHFFVGDDGAITPEPVGSFKQYPLKLAWAVTIHKSQGKTFEKVVLDLDRGTFAHGQTYVALSRCTSLKGLTLTKKIMKYHIIMDQRVEEFMRSGGMDQFKKKRLF